MKEGGLVTFQRTQGGSAQKIFLFGNLCGGVKEPHKIILSLSGSGRWGLAATSLTGHPRCLDRQLKSLSK